MENLENIYNKDYICIDIETCDLFLKIRGPGARNGAYIVGVAISDGDNSAYYPLKHKHGVNIEKHKFQPFFQELVNGKKYIIGANILYDLEFLSYYGIDFTRNKFIDIQYIEALLDSSARSYSLNTLADQYLGDKKNIQDLMDQFKKISIGKVTIDEMYKHLSSLPIETVGRYAIKDAELTVKIFLLQKKMIELSNLSQVSQLEHDLIPILLKMRLQGVGLDVARLHQTYKELNEQLAFVMNNISKVNINSSLRIAEYFKSKGIELPKTDKGNYCTDAYTLESLESNPYVKDVLLARKLDKCLGTFLRNYVYENISLNGEDSSILWEDRLFTQYHPLRTDNYGTVTGRFSSSNPNLQNIPARDDNLKLKIRSLFIPDKGSTWVSVDYNQIEYRLTTNFAVGRKSEEGRQAYIKYPTTDFHKYVMKLTGMDRKSSKVCNFLLVYGGSIAKLQQALKSDYGEATRIYETYHNNIPYIKSTYNYFHNKCRTDKEIRTILNRRIINKDKCYKGLNMFIQGSAADILKVAMVSLHKSGIYDEVGYPLLTVHDELDFSIPNNKLSIVNEIKEIMEKSCREYDIKVPLIVDISQGPNWGGLKVL